MPEELNVESIKEIIEGGVGQAQEILSDPAKAQELLQQMEEQLKNLPDTFKTAALNAPLMAQMIKSYITKEYTEVSPKVVASLVAAFLYLIKAKDFIPDTIPVLGVADDLAVGTFVMKLCEPELTAYAAWRETNPTEETVEA